MITFHNVTKTFTTKDREVTAVKDVNLTIEQGDIFGIIGFSGAGKSTLLRLVNLLEEPTEGKVTINGQDITVLSKKQLREQRRDIGMIFQNFNLFTSRTVFGNIAYPLQLAGVAKGEVTRRVNELLTFVGLTEKAKHYPEQLSGGQKQRVGIARALATSPSILICDEATSALDPNTTADILQLIQKVSRELGITVLLITHEMQVIEAICNRVAVMEEGQVIETGTVFETFSNPQHPTTQRFIRATEQDLPSAHLLGQWSDTQLYRIIFKGDRASDPLLSKITRKHDVDVNIIYGTVKELQQRFFGNLIVSFEGQPAAVAQVLQELKQIVEVKEVQVA